MSDVERYAYLGRAGCGCVRAIVVDEPDDAAFTARHVASMVKAGLTVERMTVEIARASRSQDRACPLHPRSGAVDRQGSFL